MTEPKATSKPTSGAHQPDQNSPPPAVESSTPEDIQDADINGVAGGFKIFYRPDEA